MSYAADFRARARASLEGIFKAPFLMLVLVSFLLSAISGLFNIVPYVGSIVAVLVAGPFTYGLQYAHLKRFRSGSAVEIGDGFVGFNGSVLSQNIILGLLQNIYIFLWTLLFFIPGIVKTYSYSLSYFIAMDHPELSAKECITRSREMMDGNKWRLFCLDLSFIGWYIVGAWCLGIGTLWAATYHQQARAAFYNELAVAASARQAHASKSFGSRGNSSVGGNNNVNKL